MKKKTKEAIILLIVLVLFLIYVISMIIGAIKVSRESYEYSNDGIIGKSKECYQNDEGKCFCKIENNFVEVDSYYKVED